MSDAGRPVPEETVHLLLSLIVANAAPQSLDEDALAREVDQALGQDALTAPAGARPRHLDFTNPVDVFGTIDDVIDIDIEPVPRNHPPLFRLRADFQPELEQSVHLIR